MFKVGRRSQRVEMLAEFSMAPGAGVDMGLALLDERDCIESEFVDHPD